MKRIKLYFFGILTMMLMCAALFLAGAIYDAWNKSVTETYFFQPGNNRDNRPGIPASPENDLGEAKMRDRLVKKFITEYFYVWPDDNNIEQRVGPNGVLRLMSSTAVLQHWRETMAPEIQKMSDDRMLRTATATKIYIRPQSEYWSVEYELKTWRESNNPVIAPEIQNGIMYLKIRHSPGINNLIIKRGIHDVLDAGADPAILFKFRVDDIIQE